MTDLDDSEHSDPDAAPSARAALNIVLGALVLLAVAYAVHAVFTDAPASLAGGPTDPPGDGGSGLILASTSEAADGAQVVIDCADAVEIVEPFSQVSGATGPVAMAAAARALYVGPEKYNDRWRAKADAGDAEAVAMKKGHPEAEYPGYAKLEFEIAEKVDYRLWIRAFWVDRCGNSVAVCLDDGPPLPIADSNFGRWVWTPLLGINAKPTVFTLNPGKHVITLVNREDDCYLDQILLRDAAAKAPAPTGPMSR